ncbi:MAG: leucyl/phenylalanyl-tRNA--protein transferase, partial [Gammaproteobacteria bacterium]|nr:leucyl/phenylalanyl-tRNA--protein transferase [Gammaproteobacteria bacterium]
HRLGHAHSLEVFMDGTLAGGLYGIAMGGVFFGESMFNHRPNASKIALAVLAKQLHDWSFGMIDCQVYSEHIMRFGSTLVPRVEFLSLLHEYVKLPDHPGEWRLETSLEF